MSSRDLARARDETQMARDRLLGSIHALQARVAPAALAEQAWDGVREVSGVAASRAARTVRKRPVATAAAALGLVALIARRPLARLIWRIGGGARPKDKIRTHRRRTTGDRR